MPDSRLGQGDISGLLSTFVGQPATGVLTVDMASLEPALVPPNGKRCQLDKAISQLGHRGDIEKSSPSPKGSD